MPYVGTERTKAIIDLFSFYVRDATSKAPSGRTSHGAIIQNGYLAFLCTFVH